MAVVDLSGEVKSLPSYNHVGLTPVDVTLTFSEGTDLEATDDFLVFEFPDQAYILGEETLFLVTFDDLDGGANLDIDIGVGDSDGTLDTTLIEAMNAQSAGSDNLDAGVAAPFIDVGGKYLIVSVETAAGASDGAAGDIQFQFFYTTSVKATTVST